MPKRQMVLWGVMFALEAMACGGATAPPRVSSDAARTPEVAVKEQPPPEPQAEETPKAKDAEASAPKVEPKPEPPAEVNVDPATQEIANSPGAPELEDGAGAIKRGEWVKAQRGLEAALKKIGPTAPLDAQMAARALIGRACAKLDNDPCAAREFTATLALYQREQHEGFGGDDGDKQKRTARALLAAGEALFYFAEQKRKEADKLTLPVYSGDGSRESVLKHVQTKVTDWVKRKKPLIEEAEKAYAKVLELTPAPPPRWVIASASRVGVLWGRFVAEFRAPPIPKEWTRPGPVPGGNGLTYEELRVEYYKQVDEASAPQRERARSAFTKCSELSQKLRYADEFSRTCDNWLAKAKAP